MRQRFTGYEKDDETALDFAEARMYQNRHGRFTAVDPALSSASLANPQTFNRYVYVGNNPVNITDPSGLTWIRNTTTSEVKWVDNYDPTGADAGWEDVTGQIARVTSVGADFAQAGAGVGDYVQYNATRSLTILSEEAAQIAMGTAVNVVDTSYETIVLDAASMVISTAIDYGDGVFRGAVATNTQGLFPASTPQPGDSAVNLYGQAVGTVAAVIVGEAVSGATIGVGVVTAPATGGASAAVLIPVGVVYQANVIIGAGANAIRLSDAIILKMNSGSGSGKTYQTYTKEHPETGEVYTGMTSGTGTPAENVAKREIGHHRNKDGFGPAKLDKSSAKRASIRGREHMLREHFKKNGKGAKQNNPIGPRNKNKSKYLKAASKEFGQP